jgi:hypothetical protein
LNTSSKLTAIIPIKGFSTHSNQFSAWLDSWSFPQLSLILTMDSPSESDERGLRQLISQHEDKRIELIVGTFGTPGAARNQGLKKLETDYVTFWDFDDFPRVPEVMGSLFNLSLRDQISVGKFEIIDRLTEKVLGTSPRWGSNKRNQKIISKNPGLWRWVFPINLVRGHLFQDFMFAEDQCYLFDLSPFDYEINYSDKIFYSYYVNDPTQITRNASLAITLSDTIEYIASKIPYASRNMKRFGKSLILHQWFTMIKRFKYISWRPIIRATRTIIRNGLNSRK